MSDKRPEALEWFNAMYDWYDEQILTDPRFCSEEEWEASKPIVETIRAALSEPEPVDVGALKKEEDNATPTEIMKYDRESNDQP